MNAPSFGFLADDIDWVQAPIVLWVLCVVLTMLVASARYGDGGARETMLKYRVFWIATLAVAVIAMFAIHFSSNDPMARWF